MTSSQIEKANSFRALHQAPGCFVIGNVWDAGSARILAGLGFRALATSSGASAGVLGRRDGMVTRAEAVSHCRAIVEATDLPVSPAWLAARSRITAAMRRSHCLSLAMRKNE